MRSTFSILTLVCILSVGGPLGFGWFSPDPVPVPMISKEDLKTRLDSRDLFIIDLRNAKVPDGRARMIKGATRENPATPENWADKYDRKKTLVLCCGCKEDKLSIHVAEKLIRMGFHNVYVLKGGWKEWLQASYPTELK